ncbi:MAG: Na+/H+ antiporter subunit E [Clostridia bacterium]|nr:Na+/H+ antiporter subunit E [Clostridia bacterium]
MALALFGLWMLLEGRWTVETVLTGIVLSALIWLFCWKFLDYSLRREWAFIRRIPRALVYLAWLIGQVFIAGFRTMSRIWSGREVHPHLISFRTALRTDPGKVLLSQSITLTPGTLTVDQRDDRFLVHALDDAFTEGLRDSEMEKRIRRLENNG